MLEVLIIALVLVAIAAIVIGTIMYKRKSKSDRICRTVDITSGEKKIGCICGSDDETKCQFYTEHHGDEIPK